MEIWKNIKEGFSDRFGLKYSWQKDDAPRRKPGPVLEYINGISGLLHVAAQISEDALVKAEKSNGNGPVENGRRELPNGHRPIIRGVRKGVSLVRAGLGGIEELTK